MVHASLAKIKSQKIYNFTTNEFISKNKFKKEFFEEYVTNNYSHNIFDKQMKKVFLIKVMNKNIFTCILHKNSFFI